MIRNVEATNFRKIFDGKRQFIIPFFQRGYSWDRRQWKQLFEDIYGEIINNVDGDDDYKNYEHFFSSIVVMPKENNTSLNGIQKFDVIDGQQRITTVYIILAVVREILEDRKSDSIDAREYSDKLRVYLENEKNFNEHGDYKKLKVLSSKGDRLSTYEIVFKESPQDDLVFIDTKFSNHQSMVDKFYNWLKGVGNTKFRLINKSTSELIQLSNVILDCLKVVWIPMSGDSNNAQAIFESLNARGTPLSASELLCNYIFKGFAGMSDFEKEELHHNYWLYVANKKNIVFDNYLMHLYSIGQKKNIGKGLKIYSFFKREYPEINENISRNHLERIKNYYPYYEMINYPRFGNGINQSIVEILKNLKSTSMESATPFLMESMRDYLENDKKDIKELLEIYGQVLTMIVRVKVSGVSTPKMSSMFPGLYGHIKNTDNKIEVLQSKFKEYGFFVTDEEFKNSLLDRKLYNAQEKEFVRMILVGIDKHMQKYEQYPDYSTLNTIEHVCPQRGREESGWDDYLGDDSHNEQLEDIIHTVGNLTLLSRPANSHASNNPFVEKVSSYHEITFLNRDIKKRCDAGVIWNIDAIKDRSKDMAKIALEVWKWKF
jgi:uncharacterized protein with ParB-like and HNH nuclease domain